MQSYIRPLSRVYTSLSLYYKVALSLGIILVFLGQSLLISAPRSTPSERIQADELAPAEAQEFLNNFRSLRFASDFIWIAELEYMPKRGRSQRFDCIYYGTWHDGAHKIRLVFPLGQQIEERVEYILVSGKQPEAWKMENGNITPLSQEQWLEPFTENSIYRPFDLLMPFLHWENAQYQGPHKEKSRPVQVFEIYPPESQNQENMPESVKISIDDDYNAMVACKYMIRGEVDKEFKIISYKKVQDQWIIKSTDLRDKETKDKTRLRIFEAAMNLKIDPKFFDPNYFKEPLPILDSSLFEKL